MGRMSTGPTELPLRSDQEPRSRLPVLWASLVLVGPVLALGAWVLCRLVDLSAGRRAADLRGTSQLCRMSRGGSAAVDRLGPRSGHGRGDRRDGAGRLSTTSSSRTTASRRGCIATARSSWSTRKGPTAKWPTSRSSTCLGIRPLQQYMVEFDRPAGHAGARNRSPAGAADLLGHGQERVVLPAAARRAGEARSAGRAALDRHRTVLEQHVCLLPLDQSAEELRRRDADLSHDVFGNRRQLRSVSRPGQPARRTGAQRFLVLGSQTRATDWPS